jgi:predicted outer membrane lipoprotein
MVSKFDIQKDHSELDAIDVEGNAAQFVEDDPMVRRKERTGKSSGYLTKRYRAWILGLVIVALFQLISIIILLATVFGAKSDDSNVSLKNIHPDRSLIRCCLCAELLNGYCKLSAEQL